MNIDDLQRKLIEYISNPTARSPLKLSSEEATLCCLGLELLKKGRKMSKFEPLEGLGIVTDLYHADIQKAYYKGRADAIKMFLDAIKTYDTYGYDVDELGEGNYLVRLDADNEKDFVPYIHLDDVIKCAEGVLKEQKNER